MQLETPVRDFLDWIIQGVKNHPKSGHTFWWQLTQNDTEEGSFCFSLLASPTPPLSQVHLFCC